MSDITDIRLPKAAPQHHWTDAQREHLLEARARGVAFEQIAERIGTSARSAISMYHHLVNSMPLPRSASYVEIGKLAEQIAQPGIDKHLVPLCLYMGTRSFGRIHRWWNLSIAAKEEGVESIADFIKLSHHPSFSHLCETPTKIQNLSAVGFLSRLRDNPEVTRNVSGLTEWAEHLLPRPLSFRRVPLETFEKNAAPWRVLVRRIRERKARERGEHRSNVRSQATSLACYPFIAHDPKRSNGSDLVAAVNRAVPKGLPDEVRADICQDAILAILSGEMTLEDLKGGLKQMISAGRKMFSDKWKFVGLDAPIDGTDGLTLMDTLSGDLNSGWSEEWGATVN